MSSRFASIAISFIIIFSLIILYSSFLNKAFSILMYPIPSGWGWNDSPRRPLATFQNDSTNELGLRGQKFIYSNDDFVILLLGDSQVEAATSSPTNMPERVLEKYSHEIINRPVKVFSLAASGWGQDQQLLALKNYYTEHRANMVLIWATPGNDFWENTFPDRSVTSVAGPLKPTYRLSGNSIVGPFYKPNEYYKNNILFQLMTVVIQNFKGLTLQQQVLEEWVNDLPPSHKMVGDESNPICENTTEIEQERFYANIFEYNNDTAFTLVTNEDFLNSRSHFSPYSLERSQRDNYLVQITKKLFEEIEILALSNGSKIFVFYPIREDFDVRGGKYVKCVKTQLAPNRTYHVKLDYVSILQEVVPSKSLLYFDLPGRNELSFSSQDRHLSDIGNDKVMKKVATLISKFIQ